MSMLGQGGVGRGHGGSKGAHCGLLSGQVWETWLWPKPSICCVRKVEGREGTQHPHSRKTELTRIRKTPTSHMWTQSTVKKPKGGKEMEWPCRPGLMGTGCSPDPRSSCSKSKNPERNHGLTNSRSFYKPNQGLAICVSTCLPSNPPLTFLTHLLPPLSRSTAWQGCAEMDNDLPARTNVGTVNGHGGSVPPTTRAEHDLSLGAVMMQFQLTAATNHRQLSSGACETDRLEGRKPLCDLESTVNISIAG